jgi:nucleotide-binding universal stress UspA family protein
VYIRRLLCPVDFSDCSRLALSHAAAIAGWYGAELHALHVVAAGAVAPLIEQCRASFGLTPPGHDHQPSLAFPPGALPPEDLATATTEETLRALLTAHALAPQATRAAVRTGDPAQQILGYARQAAIDLVVLGTHHAPNGADGDDAGPTITRLWRDAVCQTLLIPQDLRAHAGDAAAHLARVLAAFDGSATVVRGSTLALTLT